MKKKSRIEMARDIVSYVRKEMDKPRLNESVRNGFSAQAAPTVEKPAARSARVSPGPLRVRHSQFQFARSCPC
jgi:hypothetical protein